MKKHFIFLLFLLLVLFQMNVDAERINSNEIITGKYQYSAIEGYNKQNINTFLYKDSDFTKSSFIGSKSLEVLSIQVASASLSWYGAELDKYEIDFSQNDYNIKNLLNDMKFNNIESNKYYNSEKKENSVGVVIGYKTIIQDGESYTLLAIIPRSAGYKQEWFGNFAIGGGDIHEGFKSARDEILRFTKQYIKNNNIKGALKVWTTGYSRGAAISNLIGGFFAGGGIDYFGNDVSITPEDVYCYTIGTPSAIKNGVSKDVELSVSANRNQESYINDTIGEEFKYSKGGTVLVEDSIYDGIKSIISSDDAFALLPLEEWGFTRYGKVIPSDKELYSIEEMLNELNSISEYVYSEYTSAGNIRQFSEKAFDLKSLSIIEKDSNISQIDFFKRRLNGLLSKISTNTVYNETYENALTSIIGTYGMAATLIDDISENNSMETTELLYPLIYSYLAYASEQIQENDKANSETEAIAILVEELLSYFSGEEIDNNTFTIDDFVQLFSKYISDNENEPIADAVIAGIISIVPDDYKTLLSIFKAFTANEDATTEDGLKAFIKACYYGPESESAAASAYPDASSVRQLFYMTMIFSQGTTMPELQSLIIDSNYNYNGHGKFEDFVDLLLTSVKEIKDDNNNLIKTYLNIGELADDNLIYLLDNLIPNAINKSEELYGKEYKDDFQKHFDNMKLNITKVREIICSLFFYTEDGFNPGKSLENAITLVENAYMIAMPHFDEIYLALSRTSNRYDDDYECLEGDNQIIDLSSNEGLSLRYSFDYYLFKDSGKVFIDNIEVPKDKYKLEKGSTIVNIDSSYLSDLPAGDHSIVAKLDNDEVITSFNILAVNSSNNDTEKSEDTSLINDNTSNDNSSTDDNNTNVKKDNNSINNSNNTNVKSDNKSISNITMDNNTQVIEEVDDSDSEFIDDIIENGPIIEDKNLEKNDSVNNTKSIVEEKNTNIIPILVLITFVVVLISLLGYKILSNKKNHKKIR